MMCALCLSFHQKKKRTNILKHLSKLKYYKEKTKGEVVTCPAVILGEKTGGRYRENRLVLPFLLNI